ncbi:biotin-dependent carboxyltransferase family protein [Peribacillus acanthi]|uniref:5-oxoprolinase subunit C family protein n=1 Tax=Peribacillus acanthi TaxID=2171554 RepID=UPI000D3E0802|nr:biotin-dependent carboxyltransferase family protein [Peribacillus acanthi]
MGVKVNKPGLLTTVQDMGRYGYQRDGIIVSGSMDLLSHRLANLLVGNDENEAALEVTQIGPSLQFLTNSLIAISGGDLSPTLNNHSISLNKPFFVEKGDILAFGKALIGCRCYIAFKGGILVEKILGSKSTCLPARFGGFDGRPLLKGDVLPIVDVKFKEAPKINWLLSPNYSNNLFENQPIRFIRGRQYDYFDKGSIALLQSSSFTVTKDSNRMGFRLQGPQLHLLKKQELVTEGVTFGTVQIPSNGQPIILMADRQTTGGYPKIAQIITTDLPRLAQRKPGDFITFKEISLDHAHQLALQQENEIRSLKKIILAKWKESGY